MSGYQVDFSEGGGPVPFPVLAGPAEGIRVMSVVAAWDGAGATGDFYAALSVYSQDGVLISRTRPEQVFAPGDTGVVTYAPFLHSDTEPAPVAGLGPAFVVDNDDGVDNWNEIWIVPAGAGLATLVHAGGPNDFYAQPVISPDGLWIAYLDDSGFNDSVLSVMAIDGSGAVNLGPNMVEDLQWLDNDTIVYQRNTDRIGRVNRDGSGAAVIATPSSLAGIGVDPISARVAYLSIIGFGYALSIMDADGTNNSVLIADTLAPFGTFAPVWRLDGSRIMFYYDGGMDTVLPDGTGQTTEAAVLPDSFWEPRGMGESDFFLTDRSDFGDWRLGAVTFGTGYSLVAPPLSMRRNVSGGQAIYGQGRVFTVQNGSLMGGENSVVSVLPDGSDYTIHFTPDTSGAPLFQEPFWG